MAENIERSSSPLAEPSPIVVRRTRASTTSSISPRKLAAASSKPEAEVMFVDAPKAELDHRLYDTDRIRVAYDFARKRLQDDHGNARKLTRRTRLAFLLHQGHCLEALQEGITEECQIQIQTFETVMDYEVWLKAVLPPFLRDMVADLANMKWNQSLANAADFVKIRCAELRDKSRVQKTPGFELLSGKNQWTEIWTNYVAEAEIHKEYGYTRKDQTTTYRAVNDACHYAQLDLPSTLICIRTYAQRNGAFHNNVDADIINTHFTKVAKTLHMTIQDLYSCVPVERMEEGLELRRWFYDLKDEWFVCDDLNDPESWLATPALMKVRDDMRRSGTKSAPSTPTKPSASQPSRSPHTKKVSSQRSAAQLKYLQTEISAPPHYRLPTLEQMPPAHDYTPAKRDVSENANPSDRPLKRFRVESWASVVIRKTEVHEKFQDLEKAEDVLAQATKSLAAQVEEVKAKRTALAKAKTELGNAAADVRALYDRTPSPPAELQDEMEKLGVVGSDRSI
ncbi:unnamed protein product [Zymoseptoria tritici ST99CH_1A5]|uniref:Uncharacterized protein n=1 Tax=Zymoseptoria tritici ST99CH_1A5 TaxID=1276529 RepID=A0A1Y6LQW0_ZYMTR|nr:unnamed protein product [Zymoseptoria tritici ST99CH_1A5]